MSKKVKKERAKKYEKKVVIKATFDEVLKGMLSTPPPNREKPVGKKDKKKQ